MNENQETVAKRVIKKYPSRRLYDTATSKYISLTDVRKLVLDGIPFCIIDQKVGDDVTRNMLLQLVVEQEEAGNPIFSIDTLQQLIEFSSDSIRDMASDVVKTSIDILHSQHKLLKAAKHPVQTGNGSVMFASVAQRNIDLWQRMADTITSSGDFGKVETGLIQEADAA